MNETYTVSTDIIQCSEVSKRLDTRKEEVSATFHRGECWKAGNLFADWAFRDFEFERAVLVADNRVALIAEFMEVFVVHPYVLCELELPDEARADHEGGYTALSAVLGRILRQMRTISGAATYHAAAVHIVPRVEGIRASNVRAERHRIPMRVHLPVVEVVVSLHIGAQRRIVSLGRKHERRAATPAAHKFRRDQLLLFGRFAVLAQEVAEFADMLLQAAISHVAAVAGQNFRLWQIGGRSVFVRVAEDEFARLERRAGAGRRHFASALDDRLREPVAVAEMVVCIVERRRRL